MKKVVVFSPNRFGSYSIAVTELLRRQGIEIAAIFVQRLFNLNRLRFELGRGRSRLMKKIRNKLFFRGKTSHPGDFETLADFQKRLKITHTRVDDFSTQYGIPVHYCQTINDPAIIAALQTIRPDLIVYTGGGIVRKEVLSYAGAGILNGHRGILPHYRGTDPVEWAALEGRYDEVGLTIHFIDEGIDTGDVLSVRRIPFQPHETIEDFRDRLEPVLCQELVEICHAYLQGKKMRIPQQREVGKQYFIIHPRLAELAEQKLANRWDSGSSATQGLRQQ